MIDFVQWRRIEETALRAGFVRAGIAAVPLPGSAEEQQQRDRFLEWIANGHNGEMAWLARAGEDGVPLRSSLTRAAPWARSVVICAANYNAGGPLSTDAAPADAAWIARYAWSGTPSGTGEMWPKDYHGVLLTRLREVERAIADAAPAARTHAYVDTGPVVERHLAQIAGLGWIGKNTCVMNQQDGSWLLLGVVLTSLPLASEAALLPAADRCGSCTRCLDACPTDALIAPRQMDASRCISYLTIEKKGSIPEELRVGMGRQVFGCDICQDVCPWNRRAPISHDPEMQPRPELINPSLDWLASLDSTGFKRSFRGSPLERTGRRRLQRNVAIAMGNSGDKTHLPRLESWTKGTDPMLAEAAAWAIQQLTKAHLNDSPAAAQAEVSVKPGNQATLC